MRDFSKYRVRSERTDLRADPDFCAKVCRLRAEGLTKAIIAHRLGVSVSTLNDRLRRSVGER